MAIDIEAPGGDEAELKAALRPLLNLGVDPASDVEPTRAYVQGGNAYAQAASETSGADLVLAGGIGQRYFSVVDYTLLAGKTITLVCNELAPFSGSVFILIEGTDWTAETSNDVTAANIAAAITTAASAFVTPAQVAENVYLAPLTLTRVLSIATNDDGTGLTANSDDNGPVYMPGYILAIIDEDAGPGVTVSPKAFFNDITGIGGQFLNDLGSANNSETIHTPGAAHPDVHLTLIETGGTAGDEALTLAPGEGQHALKFFKVFDIYSKQNALDVVVVSTTNIKNVDGTDLISLRMPTDHGKLALQVYGTPESADNIWRIVWASPTVEVVPDWRFRFAEDFPTSDPGVIGQFWLNNGVLTRSFGRTGSLATTIPGYTFAGTGTMV